MSDTETAILAGGCFWCTEAVFRDVIGVSKVESGYIGGTVPEPTYKQVCAGDTGHAEAIRVTYDPAVISYGEILDVLLGTHDPTQLNRQGNDTGTQYRSGIYYTTPEQKQVAEDLVRAIGEEKLFGREIVTEVLPLANYSPAEAYHQDFFEKNPTQGYCLAVAAPKVAKFRKTFSELTRG